MSWADWALVLLAVCLAWAWALTRKAPTVDEGRCPAPDLLLSRRHGRLECGGPCCERPPCREGYVALPRSTPGMSYESYLRVEVYRTCERPGKIPPRPGDRIRGTHGTGLWTGYEVERTVELPDGSYSFVVRVASDDPEARRSPGYLNHYRLTPEGRLIGPQSPEGSTGWFCCGGGPDEILIERRAAQGWLF